MITLVKDRPDLRDVAEMHAPLIEAFRSGDPRRCGRMMREHVEHFAKWVPAEIEAHPPRSREAIATAARRLTRRPI